MTNTKLVLVRLDDHSRIALGALAKHKSYLANIGDDGVIVLTPVEAPAGDQGESR